MVLRKGTPIGLAAMFGLALVVTGCFSDTNRSGSAADETALPVKATDAAARPATATPIPPVLGGCPSQVDVVLCQMAVQLSKQSATSMPVAPLAVVCPTADRWVIAVEPVCTPDAASQSRNGFALGLKQFSFVDESTLRSTLAGWLPTSAPQIQAIGCPRETESAPLDCSSVVVVLLSGPVGTSDPVLLFTRREDILRVTGARTSLAIQPERIGGGGWIDTGHSGIQELPRRVWVIPWSP